MANIELDGVNKTIKVDSGDLTLDVPGDIILDGDGADVHFRDDGTGYLQIGNSSNDVLLTSLQSDKDMIFKGVDGGSLITALTLDMSAAGAATFNGALTVAGAAILNGGIDVAGDFNFDVGGGDITFKDDGTSVVNFGLESGNFIVNATASDTDIIFKGNDGGSAITALTLDMSAAGAATFNSSIITTGILNKVNNSLLMIGGGNATNTGSNLTLYGGADGSAGTFRFRNGTTTHFNIAGNGDLTGTDTSIGSISDSRLKENITDFTYDVVKFKQFKPKTFDWKNPAEHNGRTDNRGFIAQEIAEIDDYWTDQITINSDTEDAKLISADSDGNHNSYSLKLGKKDAMYISVIQQLITRIEALEG